MLLPWGRNYKAADCCYRSGLKTALSIRQNINTEILHIESGTFPLHCKIQKQQLKFWLHICEYCTVYPDSALSKISKIAIDSNVSYVKYYLNLVSAYHTPQNCQSKLELQYMDTWKRRFTESSADNDSKLGTYLQINPSLQRFVPTTYLTESERILTTRFRTGSHSLAIEIGRFSNIPRENRLCDCGRVQSVWHVFSECPLTRECIQTNYSNLYDVFQDANVHSKLMLIAKRLKIPVW